MNDTEIKTLVTRLSRPHSSGGVVIERAALLAAGGDFPDVMEWITAHAGQPESAVARSPRRGLHGSRIDDREAQRDSAPSRFVLPAGVAD